MDNDNNDKDHFRALSNLAPVGIFLTDREGVCTFANDRWLTISGMNLDDVINKSWLSAIHPDDRERVEHVWAQTALKQLPFRLEYRFKNSTGKIIWVLGEAVALKNKNGESVGYVGSISEINERMKVQIEAAENEQRFTNAFEYAAIGMALVSLEGKWLKVNRSVCKLLGYSEDELMKMTFQDVTHPEDLDKDLAYLQQMLRGEIHSYEMQKRYFHKNKKIVWVRLSVSMVHNQFPSPSYFISQIEDITESKRLEQELKDNEQRLQLATSSALMGIWDMDITTGALDWDDQMYALYGVNRKNFTPSRDAWVSTLHPDDFEEAANSAMEAINGDRVFDTEFRVVWPDKSVHYLKGNGTALKNNLGEPIRLIGINYEITREKEAYENLKQLNNYLDESRKVAEQATVMKSRFLDIAAHELRTPVTSFSLLLQFTEKKLAKGQPVQLETLQRLRIQGERISHLVIDLLDVSRLERGVLSMKPELVNLTNLVQTCVDDFVLRTDGRHVTCNLGPPVEANIDPVRIYQVISNLLENAAKYTPEHNPIEIAVEAKSSEVKVAVTDHGPGIPKDQQEGLFTIFSRGPTELTERSGGLGLGLFICRSIVELHHGKIGVSSTLGQGSTFSFVIPCTEIS